MKLGVFPPFGDDHEKNIAFCQDAGADCIALRPSNGSDSTGLAAELAQLKARYARSGIDTCAVMAPRITTEAMIDARLQRRFVFCASSSPPWGRPAFPSSICTSAAYAPPQRRPSEKPFSRG